MFPISSSIYIPCLRSFIFTSPSLVSIKKKFFKNQGIFYFLHLEISRKTTRQFSIVRFLEEELKQRNNYTRQRLVHHSIKTNAKDMHKKNTTSSHAYQKHFKFYLILRKGFIILHRNSKPS